MFNLKEKKSILKNSNNQIFGLLSEISSFHFFTKQPREREFWLINHFLVHLEPVKI